MEIANEVKYWNLGRLVSASLAAVEPHFIAGATVEALSIVYDHLYSFIKIDSRVANALRTF